MRPACVLNAPVIQANEALTLASLLQVRAALSAQTRYRDPASIKFFERGARNGMLVDSLTAATAVALVNTRRGASMKPAIVLTVRGGRMRTHAGEVRCSRILAQSLLRCC